MTREDIIIELKKKGYKPIKDTIISTGGTVYKYKLPSRDTERLYIVHSNINKPFFGMTEHVVEKLSKTPENFYTICLSTNNDEAYIVNKKDIIAMANGTLPIDVSTDEKGNYKLTKYDMHKIEAIHLDDVALMEFIREQL